MVAKEKLKRSHGRGADANMPIADNKVLGLEATVICASEIGKKVVTCLGCVQREVSEI